ncbi:D-serine ammonia-lyase [Halalkalibacter akibai]|uniref:Probable D-serine dehydratase n=1 Tax=Halalkalibacter akibai (strain ATCC 43226 / DSM 21942 / CIP 109018 / JCM 9157 / 1139) TaxID=1236973 RepID=W4R0E3_HALA3|nr:D-serine ammonia-lyase [Halalkalibacter akibai]GAE37378.1 D-serine dehydratase [Halalkalibacter akibai JCM 9157]
MSIPVNDLIERYPIIKKMMKLEPVFWQNQGVLPPHFPINGVDIDIIKDAAERFDRFKPFLMTAFHEYKQTNGEVESPLIKIPNMKKAIEKNFATSIKGNLYLKSDDMLPVAGSIKARGGFHEVFSIAEKIAHKHHLLKSKEDDYSYLLQPSCREVFSQYSIGVGSTGNLGLSIGMMSSKLGFNVTVHMSVEAKRWKKELLRQNGVEVIEYESDYSEAIKNGREQCSKNKNCYFIDDENSVELFAGYAVAALRLKEQLEKEQITVDVNHPLFVYLPCGVGGGPGGVTFGLKAVFKGAVHCFFAEPTHSPAMLMGLVTKKHR